MSKIRVQVTGLAELRRKVKEDKLVGEPFNKAMDAIGQDFASVAAAASPVDSGDMQRGFTWKVSTAPVARYVTIRNTSKHQRYAYPARQEFDIRMGHAHWMLGAVHAAWGQVETHLRSAARKIESIWGS